MNQQAVQGYYRLRAAYLHFEKPPEQLDEKQSSWLDKVVLRQKELETRVLRTPEAAAMVVPDQEVSRAMQEIESHYDDCQAFLSDLESLGLTVSQFNDLLEQQLRVELVLEQEASRVPPVTREDARAYYEANPEKFAQPERRRVRHLLITVNEDYPENKRDAVMARLDRIREESTRDSGLFEKRVKRYSECPSVLNSGELGWVPRGQLFPRLDEALFELEPNQVSPILETDVGLHLIQCLGIRPAGPMEFDSVVDKICSKLEVAARQRAQRAWLQALG